MDSKGHVWAGTRITAVETGNDERILSPQEKVKLRYDNNTVRICFSNFQFNHLGSTLYTCYMEGVDKDWGRQQSENHAVYRNLPPANMYSTSEPTTVTRTTAARRPLRCASFSDAKGKNKVIREKNYASKDENDALFLGGAFSALHPTNTAVLGNGKVCVSPRPCRFRASPYGYSFREG